jgi:hypothetical protein
MQEVEIVGIGYRSFARACAPHQAWYVGTGHGLSCSWHEVELLARSGGNEHGAPLRGASFGRHPHGAEELGIGFLQRINFEFAFESATLRFFRADNGPCERRCRL